MIIQVTATPEVSNETLKALDTISANLATQQSQIQVHSEQLSSGFSGITRGTIALNSAYRRIGLTIEDIQKAKIDLQNKVLEPELSSGDFNASTSLSLDDLAEDLAKKALATILASKHFQTLPPYETGALQDLLRDGFSSIIAKADRIVEDLRGKK